MRHISPITQITLALLVISCSILFIAQMTSQVFVDPDTQIAQLRQAFAQRLAVQSAALLQNEDPKTLQMVFEAARKSDPAIRSIAVRKADGSVQVQAGNHEAAWVEPQGDHSTLTEILVPLSQEKKRWGRFEITYAKPAYATLRAIVRHPLTIVVMHFLVLGSLFYWIYLRRALSVLDPTAVIPERVRIAFNSMAEGVVILDRQGRVLMTNSAFDLLPMSGAASIVGKKLSTISWLAGGLPADAAQHPWGKTLEKGAASTGDLLVIISSTSQPRQLMVNCAPILSPKGGVRGCVVTFDDVSKVYLINERLTRTLRELELSRAEIESKNAELEYTATHDSLSGCLARSAGMARLSAAMQQAKLEAQPLLVLMLDIDKFKEVNDSFGHATGDKVIQVVGATLLSVVRETDVVARHGGDEFVVTMPRCEASEAMTIAQSVRQAIMERCETGIAELAGFRVTVSIGLAAYAPELDDVSALMQRVDTALYDAKASGRNAVALA